jgi:hypothetical protein
LFIIGGTCFIILGLVILAKSTLYNYGRHIDFGGFNVIGGSIFLLIGILFIVSDIRKRISRRKRDTL